MIGLGLALTVLPAPAVVLPDPVGFDPDMWWRFTDGSLNDLSGNGRNLSASGGAVVLSAAGAAFDGGDGLVCTSPNLAAATTVAAIIEPQAGDAQFMLFESSAFSFVGGCFDADTNQGDTGSGSPTYYKNGVAIPKDGAGGTFTSRNALHDAFAPGAGPYVFEARGANMSAGWTNFAISGGGYGAAWRFAGSIKEVIVCPDPADPTEMRNYLLAQAGL